MRRRQAHWRAFQQWESRGESQEIPPIPPDCEDIEAEAQQVRMLHQALAALR